MSRKLTLLVVLVLTAAPAVTSRADIFLYALLRNAFENPPTNPTTTGGAPRPASYGTALFTLNTAQTAMTFNATIFNIDFTGLQSPDINDDLVAAHIHASATVTPTTNAGVVWGFFGAPFNDNNPNDVVVTPFATGVGGTISGKWDLPEGNNTTLAAQIPNILTNHSYINFHTRQFGGGEIRGTLEVAPEGSSLALFGAGALGLLIPQLNRFRKQKRLK